MFFVPGRILARNGESLDVGTLEALRRPPFGGGGDFGSAFVAARWWLSGSPERDGLDVGDLTRKLGLTRARVTQLLDLLLLAPDLQEAVLAMEAVDGVEPMAERTLRVVAHAGTWAEQRVAWGARRSAGKPA